MRPRAISGANSARSRAAGARIRTNALFCIERRRARLLSGAGRFQRPRSRYEDLWLAVALGEAERRCVASTEPRRLPEIDRAIIAGVERRIADGKLSLERAARWLSPSARYSANERGKRRLQEIAVAVKAEIATGELNARAAPVAGEMTAECCTSLTREGSRCKNERARMDSARFTPASQKRSRPPYSSSRASRPSPVVKGRRPERGWSRCSPHQGRPAPSLASASHRPASAPRWADSARACVKPPTPRCAAAVRPLAGRSVAEQWLGNAAPAWSAPAHRRDGSAQRPRP